MRALRRLAAAAAALAVAAGLALAWSAPARAAAPAFLGGVGLCTAGSGALVAVDFRALEPGSIVRGCDPTPTNGKDLLTTAGFTTSGTVHDGPQFVCRIGHAQYTGIEYPTPATEPCGATPPASRYWSYWVADPGSTTWRYSSLGAYANPVSNGTAEAWVYGSTTLDGSTGQPSFTPTEVRTGAAAPTAPGAFASVAPYRLTDTRQPGNGGIVPAQTARTIQVTGRGGVPATGVSAVVVNLTITEPAAAGNLIAYAAGTTPPLASNLNFVPGQTIPNLAVVPVNANGQIALYNSSPGTTHVIADVAGYYLR